MGGRIRTFAAGAAAGAGLAYFLDPERGAARRAKAVDMTSARVRRAGRELGREARYRSGQVEGLRYRAAHGSSEEPFVDDATLKDRVESEVFGPDFPKGDVNITVVDGIVELRGQLRRLQEINDLVRRVEKVPGVVEVHNMLHLPQTPAPNKREAREAG